MTSPMMQLVFDASRHLRWGLDVEAPELPPADHVVVLGMGGSGMAGTAGALGAGGDTVVAVYGDYGLPSWAVSRRALIVAVSYSGNTEETVAGIEAAIDAGLPVAAVASGGRIAEIASQADAPSIEVPGGLQPRAALGYLSAATLRVLEAAGAVDAVDGMLTEAADIVDDLLRKGEGAGYRLAVDIAEALEHRLPVIVGPGGPAALAARRWMTQINENAKRAAFFAEIPEMNHNALEAWAAAGTDPAQIGVVALSDPAGHPRNERRLDLTMRRIGGNIAGAGNAVSQGDTAFARFWSLVAVGDVASVAMAEGAGVDPEPVEVLEGFKQALRED